MPDFDLAVIGAGSAGLSVANVAARLGVRVALVERHRMGGDCLNTGCVPSKALLAASHAASAARAAGRFGVRAEVSVDWDAVRGHVDGVIANIAPADSQARYEGFGATVLRDTARFTGRHSLDVGGRTVTARTIVVAAGSRATVPDIPGLAAAGYVTHETVFSLPRLPAHLLILGGGSIGIELAQAFAGLGSRVTVVEQRRLGGREDPELVDVLRPALGGVEIVEGVAVSAVEPGPTLVLADGRRIAGTDLLVAAGRTPNLEALDCEAAGLSTSARGIAVGRGLRARGTKNVFAIGDIADVAGIGPTYLTHAASHHAGVVIRQVLFRLPARVGTTMPRVIYTDPELAQVGLTEQQARDAGHVVTVQRWPLADNDRAVTERSTVGLVKLVVARGRLLGAGIVAPHAGEMIDAFTLAIRRRVPVAALADLIVPYPTRFEAAKRAAGVALADRLFSRGTRRIVSLLARLP